MARDGVARCRSCSAPIWWRKTRTGKYQPMDIDLATNSRTYLPHFSTCQMKTYRAQLTATEAPKELPF